MRRAVAPLLAIAPSLVGGAVLAAGAAAPPAGWERAPAPTIVVPSPTAFPACCATDSTCCGRQLQIDAHRVPPPSATLELTLAELPEATVRSAPAPEPGIDGAPALRVMDGRGQPPPWKDGPFRELRLAPPGMLGDISRGDFYEPFFESPALRSQGYGVTHSVTEGSAPFAARPYQFHALAPGPDGTVRYDYVEGVLDARLRSVVRTWVHADAKHLARDVLFAFRSSDEAGERVHLVLPEVILGEVSSGVTVHGGFESGSRFSRSWAFTTYSLPSGPGAAEHVTFSLVDTQIRTMQQLGITPASLKPFSCAVDVSRATGEPSARVSVHVFDDP